jgi:amino acid transporter
MSEQSNPKVSGPGNPGGKVKLKRTLGLSSLLLFGMAMMFPVAPVAVFGEVSTASGGLMPLCYLIAVIPMSFTAYSYGKMASEYPTSGSVYTYTSKSLHPFLGFIAGWAIFLDYALFPILNYVVIGIYMEVLFGIPAWISVIVAIIIVTVINLLGIKTLSIVNNALVVFMFLAVIYFIVAAAGAVSGGTGLGEFTALPFYNSETFDISTVLLGTSIACFSFMGFDAMTTLGEEVKEPKKNLPKAPVMVCFIMGAIFIVQAYFAQSVFPDFTQFTSNDEAFLDAAGAAGGGTLITVISIAMVAGSIANAIDSQAGVARIMYGMGRDEMLPKKVFAYLHPKTQVPVYSALILAVMAVIVVIVLNVGLGAVVTMINFGALTAFMFVNISVIAHFFVRGKQRAGANILKFLIMPFIGFATCLVLFISLAAQAKIVGFIWLAIGIIVLAISSKGFKKTPADLEL